MTAAERAVALARRYVRQGRGQEDIARMLRVAGLSPINVATNRYWNGIHDDICNADGTVRGIDRSPSPYWHNHTSSACAGRDEYGTPSEQGDNSSQSVIGLPRCGGGDGVPAPSPDISPRASGQSFQGVPIQWDPVMARSDEADAMWWSLNHGRMLP